MPPRPSTPPALPSSLSAVTLAWLTRQGARFDPAARVPSAELRARLGTLKLAPWPVLLEIERDFGGLRFAEGRGDWLLGPIAVAKAAPRLRRTRTKPVPLVCVGFNDTGGLFADESGQIWDDDAAANSLRLRSATMAGRLEREAYGFRIGLLGQRSHQILPRVGAAAAAKKLRLPLIEAASDEHERVWQSSALTVWESTDDVRVFAKSPAALAKAVAAFGAR